jgi:choline transport protein
MFVLVLPWRCHLCGLTLRSGYVTIIAFVAYTILLLVKAPKASARSVFVTPTNETGYVATLL